MGSDEKLDYEEKYAAYVSGIMWSDVGYIKWFSKGIFREAMCFLL